MHLPFSVYKKDGGALGGVAGSTWAAWPAPLLPLCLLVGACWAQAAGATRPITQAAGATWPDTDIPLEDDSPDLLLPERGPLDVLDLMADPPPTEASQNQSLAAYTRELLLDIGGGTGATLGGTGNLALDRALMRRMRSQDKAVMLLLLVAYMGSLLFSASLAYRQARNNSRVTYYADPRYHNAAVEGHDAGGFLQAFNQPPKDIHLRVTGYTPTPDLPDYVVDTAVEWIEMRYQVAFSFALDLSPWVTREDTADGATGAGCDDSRPAEARAGADSLGPEAVGVSAEAFEVLRDFLANDTNDLAIVELRKEVEWPQWEELATNIKHQIRQSGFHGTISVQRHMEEHVQVYKNRPWANFMHSRTTRVLCALSIVGWFLYQPYMWLRHRPVVVRSQFCVNVDIGDYWPLIAERMGTEGFDERLASTAR